MLQLYAQVFLFYFADEHSNIYVIPSFNLALIAEPALSELRLPLKL